MDIERILQHYVERLVGPRSVLILDNASIHALRTGKRNSGIVFALVFSFSAFSYSPIPDPWSRTKSDFLL